MLNSPDNMSNISNYEKEYKSEPPFEEPLRFLDSNTSLDFQIIRSSDDIGLFQKQLKNIESTNSHESYGWIQSVLIKFSMVRRFIPLISTVIISIIAWPSPDCNKLLPNYPGPGDG